MEPELRIGDAARRLGVASHVLRHWEDVGVLVPRRTTAGYRIYDDELVRGGRLVQLCQRAGFTLREIAELSAADRAGRVGLVRTKRRQIAREQQALDTADSYLAHILECRHPVVSKCPECAAFSQA
ncbi:MAG TPA: MerR family transcriptional regulator [Kribbellaceae bacterium]|nr:MerR family transcriptional regulator [Kribbellaceae bacterium]